MSYSYKYLQKFDLIFATEYGGKIVNSEFIKTPFVIFKEFYLCSILYHIQGLKIRLMPTIVGVNDCGFTIYEYFQTQNPTTNSSNSITPDTQNRTKFTLVHILLFLLLKCKIIPHNIFVFWYQRHWVLQ